jgi:hypothetical protein
MVALRVMTILLCWIQDPQWRSEYLPECLSGTPTEESPCQSVLRDERVDQYYPAYW